MDFLSQLLQGLGGAKKPATPQGGRIPTYAQAPDERRQTPENYFNILEKLAASTPSRGNVIDRRFTPWQYSKMPQNIEVRNPQLKQRSRDIQGSRNASYGNNYAIQLPDRAENVQGALNNYSLNYIDDIGMAGDQTMYGDTIPVRQLPEQPQLRIRPRF